LPEADLALLIRAARAAGDIATRFTGPTAKRWDKPNGAGPVTEADLAVNEALQSDLRAARPDYGWLSEETDDNSARLNCARTFIIDPIDGTRSFIEGSRTWAHALAIAEHGIVTAAVVYLPLLDKLYSASAGTGAFLNGVPIRTGNRNDITGASILAAKPTFADHHWRGPVPDMVRAYRPSLAYRLSLVAEGRFDAMLTLRPTWEWDIAAGDLILREAGAQTSDRSGAALRFNNPTPQVNGILAANPELHRSVVSALVS
jgi:myo-inositol-1(or 4)-monophosphatase